MVKPKIAVIGASSLIGSWIFHELLRAEYLVTGTCFENSRPGLARLDITDPQALEDFVGGYDLIVNSTGVVGKNACAQHPKKAFRVNEEAAIRLAELCRDKRLVHLSSVAVFDKTKQVPYTEEDEVSLIEGDLYNQTKARAEQGVEQANPGSLIARIGNTYGYHAHDTGKTGGSVFAWAYNTLRAGEKVTAFQGDSSQTLISDIGAAIEILIQKGYEGRINIGGENLPTYDFFQAVKKHFNLPGEVVLGEVYENRALDLTRLQSLKIPMKKVSQGLKSLERIYRVDA